MIQKLLITAGLLLSSHVLLAQPVLTSAINPQAGDSFNFYSSNMKDPGNPGPGQLWDFSAATGSPFIVKYRDCGTHPNPDCIYNFSGNTYFMNDTVQAFVHYGTSVPSGSIYLELEDLKVFMKFPFTYTDSLLDYYYGVYSVTGMERDQNGVVRVSADGFGTLLTPAGTFENVLRVKEINEYVNAAGSWSESYYEEIYRWYRNDYRQNLYTTKLTIHNGTDTFRSASWLHTSGLGISSETAKNTFQCVPNPVKDIGNISFYLSAKKEVAIYLVDMTGRTCAILTNQEFESGNQSISCNLNNLSPGLYTLVFKAYGEAPRIQKLVK